VKVSPWWYRRRARGIEGVRPTKKGGTHVPKGWSKTPGEEHLERGKPRLNRLQSGEAVTTRKGRNSPITWGGNHGETAVKQPKREFFPRREHTAVPQKRGDCCEGHRCGQKWGKEGKKSAPPCGGTSAWENGKKTEPCRRTR